MEIEKKAYSKPVLKQIGDVATSTEMLQSGTRTDVPIGSPVGPDIFSG